MKVLAEIVESSERRAPGAAEPEGESFAAIAGPSMEDRRANLSFAGAKPTATEFERMMGTNDLVDEFYLERALAAAKPVCRIVLRTDAGRERGFATGFLISPRVVMTNWHVFPEAEEARNAVAEFEYKFDIRGNPVTPVRFRVRPDLFFHATRELDYALVAVEEEAVENGGRLSQFGYHRLARTPGKILEGEWITIIQHPAGQRRQYAIRENQLVAKLDSFLWYMSDTAQGSSGAPAFNDSFQVVALHHSGKARKEDGQYVLRDGRRVVSLDGIEEEDVIWEKNEGVRVSVMCADMKQRLDAAHPYVQEIETAIESEQGHAMERVMGGEARIGVEGGIVIPLQLHISVSSGGAGATVNVAPAAVPSGDEAGFEKLIPPPVDTEYGNRTGYDPDFLVAKVPLPRITKPSLVSKLDNGRHVIPYEHFSVVMHKTRRLAVFTASNVDGRAAQRRPEAGVYSRKALFGIRSDNDKESWLTDPRIPKQHQVPEVFYDKDGGAFDKGHIVRREDVCWGGTRDQVVKANADSYHVTNCSPQVAGYNQSAKKGVWGQLEEVVLKQVQAEQKFTVLAGPVLADDDKVFEGRDFVGKVRIQIPKRFWKVVVAEKDGKLQAFGFLLEQDLKNVQLETEEFQVTEEWAPFLIPLQELEDLLKIVKFPAELKNADGARSAEGEEMVLTGAVRRRE